MSVHFRVLTRIYMYVMNLERVREIERGWGGIESERQSEKGLPVYHEWTITLFIT